jgi:hypothetical protein
MHLFNIHLHSIVCPYRSITMFKRLNPDKDVLQVQHHSHLLLEFTRSWLSLNNISPGVIWMFSFIDYLSLNHIVLRSPILHLIIFLCPLVDLNTTYFSFSGSTVLPPGGSTFQGVLRRVDVISIEDFANSIWCSSCLTIFLVLESNLIFQRSCLFKSNCWNEIKEMSIFEKYFWNSSFFGQRRYTLFNVVLWLSCILKTEMTRCKIKMTFFMVLCVSFNLWSRVYLLMVCNEVTFYEFQEKQGTRVKTWGFITKGCFFFLAPILSACIIISSLIHEVTTLMEQLFKFLESHLSVQIAYLIKKGF